MNAWVPNATCGVVGTPQVAQTAAEQGPSGRRAYADHQAPLTEVGALLDARAVHPGRTARNHLLALAAATGIDPGRTVNGLDPEGILWIRTLLESLAAQGRTVFVSSHLISDMALTAEQLIIVGRGRLIADVSVAELTRGTHNGVRVRSPRAATLRAALAGVYAYEHGLVRPSPAPEALSASWQAGVDEFADRGCGLVRAEA